LSRALFVHGWATDRGVWENMTSALGVGTDGALNLNLPGHGSPARWPEPSLNPALLCLAKALSNEEERLTGFGWSLGAEVLLSLAARFPEKFSTLILVGATPCFIAKKDFPHGQSRALVRRMIMDMKEAPEETLKRFYPLNFTEEELNSKAVAHFMKRYAPPGPMVCEDGNGAGPSACHQAFNYADITTGLGALYNTDIRGLLAKIKTPVLLIHGSNDNVVPLGAAEFMAANIKNARLEVFPCSGHAPFITSEKRFIEVVKGFSQDVCAA